MTDAPSPRCSSGRAPAPEGATHIRQPEYITAWLFDGVSTMPLWLIEKYKSIPIPEPFKGRYATAIDGEFWRWMDADQFNRFFVPIPGDAQAASASPNYEREARNLANVWANGNHGARTCIWAALLRAAAAPERPLVALILEYAHDLRRNSSGGDDYPWEWAKATADYLETLIERSGSALPSAEGNTP